MSYSNFEMQTGKSLPILIIGILLVTTGCSPQSGESTKEQSQLLTFIDAEGHQVPVTTKTEWNKKRMQILDDMQLVMGDLPEKSGLPDFDLHYTDSLEGNNYKRYTINFLAAENERVTAYLYIPSGGKTDQRIPAMLTLHETDSLGKGSVDGQGKNINLAYAKELAQRGYIVIAPDYPSFGESHNYNFENDRYESGTMKGIFNHIRCIDLLQSMPVVDPERIGVIGHSLGGHNSIFVGAFDERLKVVVSSCGWTGYDFYNIGEELAKKYGGRLGPWAQERYMPLLREKYELDAEQIPFDFDEMISAIAPRVFFSSSPVNDSNFDVKGVQHVMGDVTNVYRFLDVPGNVHVYYPDCKHDFPTEMRTKAYALIDSVFQHKTADTLN
jgi:pimeloyl-ACP methyl ester carboxylesterase